MSTPISTSAEIGNFGEDKVIGFAKDLDFKHVFVFENASKNGLDVVGVKTYRDSSGKIQRYIVSAEVKTTMTKGSGPRLSITQKEAFINTGTILVEAATKTGRFGAIGPHLQKSAAYLLSAIAQNTPVYPVHVRLQITRTNLIGTAQVKRARMHTAIGAGYRRSPSMDTNPPRRRR